MSAVLLHIGTHKTGTTSIQRLLAALETRLAGQGILYPLAGRPPGTGALSCGQHELAWSISGRRKCADPACWDKLRREIAERNAPTAVISSEDFECLSREQVQRVAEELSGHSVRVVVYLRNQWDFMVSSFKQQLKSRNRSAETLRESLVRRIGRCDYADLIDRWSQAFGREMVTFRLYDKIKRAPGLEADFLGLLDSAALAGEVRNGSIKANVSPTDDDTRLIRALNRIETKLPRTTLVAKLCHRVRRKLARSGPWVRRCSTMTAGWLAPPLSGPEDVAFLREHVREFNDRFFGLLDDPADAAFFEIRDPQ